jgi:pimeloyl-ACP methyl ester carboxylesterase
MAKKSKSILRWLLIFLLILLVLGVNAFMNMSRPGRRAIGELRQVSSDGTVLKYHVCGTGKPLIMIPSLGREASDFNEIVPALNKAGYRTIAVEARSPGSEPNKNPKPLTFHDFGKDINAIVSTETKSDESLVLFGHALGNRIARVYATDFPSRVRALILIAAGGKVEIDQHLRDSMKHCFWTFMPDFWRLGEVKYAFFADTNKVPYSWKVGWNISTAKLQKVASEATPSTEWWAGGTAPMLVVQGVKDRVAPAENSSKLLKEEFGDRVTVAMIENAGHALLPEQPAAIEKAVVEFLNHLPEQK